MLARLRQGDGGALVLTAPPGLGRTALLREAAAAHRPGARCCTPPPPPPNAPCPTAACTPCSARPRARHPCRAPFRPHPRRAARPLAGAGPGTPAAGLRRRRPRLGPGLPDRPQLRGPQTGRGQPGRRPDRGGRRPHLRRTARTPPRPAGRRRGGRAAGPAHGGGRGFRRYGGPRPSPARAFRRYGGTRPGRPRRAPPGGGRQPPPAGRAHRPPHPGPARRAHPAALSAAGRRGRAGRVRGPP
ncbi:hypothetical protein ACN24M_31380 [Streptomyces microflavus]